MLLGQGRIEDLAGSDLLENLNGNIVGPHNITKAFSPFLLASMAEKKQLVYISSLVGSFGALPTPLRELVAKHVDAAALNQRVDSEKQSISLQQELTTKGLVFSKPDPQGFRAALQKSGFYSEWKTKFGEEAWAQVEAVDGKLA